MFGILLEGILIAVLGVAISNSGFAGSIGELVGSIIILVGMLYFAIPAVSLIYKIYKEKNIHYHGWTPSIRKIGYLVVLVMCIELNTYTWWQTIIIFSLAITSIYHFIFTNNKREEGIIDFAETMEKMNKDKEN